MRLSVKIINEHGQPMDVHLDAAPDKCAVCGRHGDSKFVAGCLTPKTAIVYAAFRCPIATCRGLYVGIYRGWTQSNPYANLANSFLPHHTQEKEFQKNITEISPTFCEIFNQAHLAEENGLNHICGPGYRKALEFLIKDFLILHKFKSDATKKEEIEKTFLGPVIQKFIDDERIKQCAKRAVWLGNDETHYVRNWEDKDLKDLKSLILLTVNFTDSSIEADRYLADMAEGKS